MDTTLEKRGEARVESEKRGDAGLRPVAHLDATVQQGPEDPSGERGAHPRAGKSYGAVPEERKRRRYAPHDLGQRGEEAARAFLSRHGFEIIETNWSCYAGEVDIIASDDDGLHFIEVKTRRGTGRGFPAESVNRQKRERYERLAEAYLDRTDLLDIPVHFDIISIIVRSDDRAILRMHCNAFSFD